MTDEIRRRLFQLRDADYGAFQAKLLPTVPPDTIIGVRTPALRKLARELARDHGADAFLGCLPHAYFDENQLHAFILSEMRDFGMCLKQVERFLLYVDNWATCDQMSPKVFKKHRQALRPYIEKWIGSGQTYTVRFGIGMLMEHFLDADFDPACLALAADVRSEAYYVRMMAAWFFATALAKQYDAALPYLEERRLDPWTHNKTIQKAVESDRISPETKEYLRGLKVKLPKGKKL